MANPVPVSLSKSRFIAGRQCERRLWLEIHEPETRDALDASAQAIFRMGTEVGELAQRLYPDGILIEEAPHHKAEALAATQRAVSGGAPAIFEAAAEGGGGYCRADILVRAGDQWDILEVKSSGGNEDQKKDEEDVDVYLWDMAHQRVVFEAAGYRIRNSCLVLVNKDYVKQGALDVQHLFVIEERNAEVAARVAEVRANLVEFQEVLRLPEMPNKLIGLHCSDPYDCPFQGRCWADVPEYSIFDLRRIAKKKAFPWYHSGKRLPEDLPVTDLTDFQALQVRVKRTGKTYVDINAVKEFLGSLVYPIRHFDFETINPAVPRFDGTRPYQRLVFQYSVHLEQTPGAVVVHSEYLPTHTNDPRKELLERLLQDLGTEGTLLCFNAGFEKGVLRDLAELYPEHKPAVDGLLERVVDLATPFSKGWVLHPGFKGRYSMKVILPALVPEMTYEGMAVGDGGAASATFLEFLDPKTTQARRDAIRRDLIAYCGQDTGGMVEILKYLRGLVK